MKQNDCFKIQMTLFCKLANAVGYENGSKFTSTFKGLHWNDSSGLPQRYNYILHISTKSTKNV